MAREKLRSSASEAIVLIVAAACILAVTGIGLATYSLVALSGQASRADQTARDECLRTVKYGPAVARAYERFEILTPDELKSYRATIPRSCP